MEHLDTGLYSQVRKELAELKDMVARGEEVPVQRLASTERLIRLEELLKQTRRRRSRWPVVVLLGGALAIMSILLFTRVPEIGVELELVVSELGFKFSDSGVLADSMSLTSIGVTGVDAIRLPRTRNMDRRDVPTGQQSKMAVRLGKPPDNPSGSVLTIAPLQVDKEARVWIERSGDSSYRFSIDGEENRISVHAYGPVVLVVAGRPSETLEFPVPATLGFDTTGTFQLELELPRSTDNFHLPRIAVNGLSLERVDEYTSSKETLIRPASTILSGMIHYESLDGQTKSLRRGQLVNIGWCSGVIELLRADEGNLVVRFWGRVRGLETGWGETSRSLMPTLLDWLHSRHGVSLFWGGAVYLSGLFMAIFRWWGVKV